MIHRIRRYTIPIVVAGGVLTLAATGLPAAAAQHSVPSSKPGTSVVHYTVTTNSRGSTVKLIGPHPGVVVRIHGKVMRLHDGVAHAAATRAESRLTHQRRATCALVSVRPEWTVSRHIINGAGSQSCVGSGYAPQRVKVAVQHYLGLGFWHNDKVGGSSFTNLDFTSWITDYVCSGTGTHRYRTVTDGYTQGGAMDVTDPSSERNMTCTG